MTIHLDQERLSYISVPKSACTSLKLFFFEIENGVPFRPFTVSGKSWQVHDVAPSIPFAKLPRQRIETHARIAVVRSPVDRVISCYANKVVSKKTFARPKIAEKLVDLGLPVAPTVNEFVAKLEAYREAVPLIRDHTRRLGYYLGPDPAYYARLFAMTELADLADFVADHLGRPVPALSHVQVSRSEDLATELTADNRRAIETLYARDLELYGRYM